RWGERITYTQILGALEALTGASDLSIVYRGLQRAIDDGLIVEVRRNGTAYGYLPGPALERVLNATRRRALA
ncbi:MAG: hypothetical protein IT386_11530, partial [Deltaproteobacteria bacterium]|nr:hypothetical protein [Deltaproteobacteria bacterium]